MRNTNVGDANVPTNGATIDNATNLENIAMQICDQKLESKWKKIKQLEGAIMIKQQKNLIMKQKVVKEFVPVRLPELAEISDTLQSKISLRKLLEFMHEFGHKAPLNPALIVILTGKPLVWMNLQFLQSYS